MRTWLLALRKSKGISQAGMAKMLGCSQNNYHYIETEPKRSLKLLTAAKIAEFFNLELKDILTYEQEQ